MKTFLTLSVLLLTLFINVNADEGNTTHAYCPPLCQCGEETMNCVGSKDSFFRLLSENKDKIRNYTSIKFSGCVFKDPIFGKPLLPNITRITFVQCEIDRVESRSFHGVPNLKNLYFDHCYMKFFSVNVELKNLREFRMRYHPRKQYMDDILKSIFRTEMPKLESLILQHNQISQDLSDLICYGKHPNLDTLDLSFNEITTMSTFANKSCHNPNLREINLEFNQITKPFGLGPDVHPLYANNPMECEVLTHFYPVCHEARHEIDNNYNNGPTWLLFIGSMMGIVILSSIICFVVIKFRKPPSQVPQGEPQQPFLQQPQPPRDPSVLYVPVPEQHEMLDIVPGTSQGIDNPAAEATTNSSELSDEQKEQQEQQKKKKRTKSRSPRKDQTTSV